MAAWFLVVEAATEAWYLHKESQVAETQPWNIAFPDPADPAAAAAKGFYNFETREMGEKEREILRFREGISGSWRDGAGNHWTAFYLQWEEDKRLNQNDLSHNPTSCLPAAGLKLVKSGPEVQFSVGGKEVPFRSWIFEAGGMPLFVFLGSRKALDFEMLELTRDRRARAIERFISKPALGMRGNPLQTVQLFVAGPQTMDEAVELARAQIQRLQG